MTPRRPRIAVFLFDCEDPKALAATVARIPEAAAARIAEVIVMAGREPAFSPEDLGAERSFDLRIHRQPRESGYGGAPQGAFEHALSRGLRLVVRCGATALHPPEALPELLTPR